MSTRTTGPWATIHLSALIPSPDAQAARSERAFYWQGYLTAINNVREGCKLITLPDLLNIMTEEAAAELKRETAG